MIILLLFILLIAVVMARIIYECRHFQTEYYEIKSEKIPEAFHDFRFVVISDLHNYDFGHNNQALLTQIDLLHPDAVMIAGDMIDAHPGADMQTAIQFMKDICDKYPVYFANGNHEQRISLYPETYGNMNERWLQAIVHPNLYQLHNTHVCIERDHAQLMIYGLELDRIYFKRLRKTEMSPDYLFEVLGKCNEDCYNILIAHNPQYFKEYANWGADLVLSGHVHGGVVILPFLGGVLSPQIALFPEYYAGLYAHENTRMILSRGLHMHSIRVRLFNMPELSCVTLRRN
jgi:predicted MPP superfamily phosphohydrolase